MPYTFSMNSGIYTRLSLKYKRSTRSGFKDKEIRNFEIAANTYFLFFSFTFEVHQHTAIGTIDLKYKKRHKNI